MVKVDSKELELELECVHESEDRVRVPGLPIRDCTRDHNSRNHMQRKISAIDVTTIIFFERLYLILGVSPFESRVNCPYSPTPPPLTLKLFLDLRVLSPHFLLTHDSPSNLRSPSTLESIDNNQRYDMLLNLYCNLRDSNSI